MKYKIEYQIDINMLVCTYLYQSDILLVFSSTLLHKKYINYFITINNFRNKNNDLALLVYY
jgi:hypothetical protein